MTTKVEKIRQTKLFRHFTSNEIEAILLQVMLNESKETAIVRPKGRKVEVHHVPETDGSPAYRTGTAVRVTVEIDHEYVEDANVHRSEQ